MGFLKQVVSDSRRPINTIQQGLKVPSSQASPMPVEYGASATSQGIDGAQYETLNDTSRNDQSNIGNHSSTASNALSDASAQSSPVNKKDKKIATKYVHLHQSIVQQNIDKRAFNNVDNVTNEFNNKTVKNSVNNLHKETHLHNNEVNKEINNISHQSVTNAIETSITHNDINQIIANEDASLPSDKNDSRPQSTAASSIAEFSNANGEDSNNLHDGKNKVKDSASRAHTINAQQPNNKANRNQSETSHISDTLASGIAREIIPPIVSTLGQNTGNQQRPATRVQIGQVNVVVESPKAPASKSSNKKKYDASSRLFLRGL